MPRILLIEREHGRFPSYAPTLRQRGFSVQIESNIGKAVTRLRQQDADLIILDAASMKTSGIRMRKRLLAASNGTPFVRIINGEARPHDGENGDVVLVHPFTSRKLLNHIQRLMPPDPGREIQAGPIRLDTENGVVHAHGKRVELTPRTMAMLLHLLKHRGKLVSREKLMQEVWGTDYTGDMRTIDVHASWLRRAIEPDPDSPRYLRTIRGIGYRLDLE